MSVFSGISQAEVYGAGQYIQPGTHDLEIHEISVVQSSQHNGRNYFCVEADVIASTNEKHAPGSRVTWLVNMQQPSALSNCLGFALALDADATKADINEEFMDKICGADQPARGTRVKALAHNVTTRAGGDFTKVTWEASA
jgi:hypothetical protein